MYIAVGMQEGLTDKPLITCEEPFKVQTCCELHVKPRTYMLRFLNIAITPPYRLLIIYHVAVETAKFNMIIIYVTLWVNTRHIPHSKNEIKLDIVLATTDRASVQISKWSAMIYVTCWAKTRHIRTGYCISDYWSCLSANFRVIGCSVPYSHKRLLIMKKLHFE